MKGKLFILVTVLLVFVTTYLFYNVWQTQESDSNTANQIKDETSSTQNETFIKNTSMVERQKQTSIIQEKKQIKKSQSQHSRTTVSQKPYYNLTEEHLTEPEPLYSNASDLDAYTETTYEELTPPGHHITVHRVDKAFEELDQKVQVMREKFLH